MATNIMSETATETCEVESVDALMEDLAAIDAVYVYPQDATILPHDLLTEMIEASEELHRFAERLSNGWLRNLAHAICSPAIHKLNGWAVAYLAYEPLEAVVAGCRSDVAAAALRQATRAAQQAEPRSSFELCWKIRTAVMVGFHARLRGEFHLPGADAGEAYRRFREHLDRLPNWLIGGVLMPRLLPQWITDLGTRPANRDAQLVLDTLRDAGPGWQAAIAADIQRLMRGG